MIILDDVLPSGIFNRLVSRTVEKFKSENNNLKEFMNGEIHGKV